MFLLDTHAFGCIQFEKREIKSFSYCCAVQCIVILILILCKLSADEERRQWNCMRHKNRNRSNRISDANLKLSIRIKRTKIEWTFGQNKLTCLFGMKQCVRNSKVFVQIVLFLMWTGTFNFCVSNLIWKKKNHIYLSIDRCLELDWLKYLKRDKKNVESYINRIHWSRSLFIG